jgi:hypothetical protein
LRYIPGVMTSAAVNLFAAALALPEDERIEVAAE